MHDNLRFRVEALRLLEDVHTRSQVLEGLTNLRGGVEALRLLEDVHARSKVLKGLTDLLRRDRTPSFIGSRTSANIMIRGGKSPFTARADHTERQKCSLIGK